MQSLDTAGVGQGRNTKKNFPWVLRYSIPEARLQQSHLDRAKVQDSVAHILFFFFMNIFCLSVFSGVAPEGNIYTVQTVSCGGARFPSVICDGGCKASPPGCKQVKYW